MKSILKILLICAPFWTLAQNWQMKQAPLMTSFSQDIDPENVLPEYPRPQLERDRWMNLNGIWQFQPGVGAQETVPAGDLSDHILVPFAIESAISGVKEHYPRVWYRRHFSIPESWSAQRIRLNLGAVDYESEVFINGIRVGSHVGGYDSFSFDITDYLTTSGEQEITIRVYDPTDSGGFPRGKQTLYPGGIMYTSVTGIWQTVWLEPLPEKAIEAIRMVPDIDQQHLTLTVNTTVDSQDLTLLAKVKDEGNLIQTVESDVDQEVHIPIPSPKLWSPDSPFLYDIEITLLQDGEAVDSVKSYFGMRKISVEDDGGFKKLYLNNEFLFHHGPLDQGFWPDGIYTAPTDEALKYDIEMTKAFGFNMIRKHIKVEPYRWYYWADKLGVLVWQDMPSANSYTNTHPPVDQVAYEKELTRMVESLQNSPCIVMWVIFNESQGQHRTPELVSKVMTMDPSRVVNQASGGSFFNVGHVLDIHNYPPPAVPVSSTQVLACGEFGGVGYKVPGHLWNDGFGYVMAGTEEEFFDYYEAYMEQLTLFKTNNGLSAAVYTEITDVEIEVNGLLTYDRLEKFDLQRIKAANTQVIERDIFLTDVIPSSQKEGQIWQYTNTQPPGNWIDESFNDSGWNSGRAGFGTTGTPGAVVRTLWNSSDIWIRRKAAVGDLSGINRDNLVLSIHHDENCEVYINGVLAATTTGWTNSYINIPISTAAKNAIRSNSMNTIAIHCRQTDGGQYIDAGISLLSPDEPAPEIPTGSFPIKAELGETIRLFPSPAETTIRFSKPFTNPIEASIIDTKGRTVKQLSGPLDLIHVADLKPGLYLIKVKEKSSTHSFKFIKK